MDQQKTGAFLAARRKELGLTQQDLGIQLGVTNKTISRWETGAYLPDLATIPELCRILGISVNEFFRGETIPPKTSGNRPTGTSWTSGRPTRACGGRNSGANCWAGVAPASFSPRSTPRTPPERQPSSSLAW
ncbi:MAG: helix-turn-helix domain-containing protein [Ruminiclostridium sp.]|nr:helix-turn-helix domain-containing protein [Ruminiclostridium sp.]